MLPKKVKKRASLLVITSLVTVIGLFFISVGDLKYKIFLFNDWSIKKIPVTDTSNVMAKSDALFFAFFGSIKCFK